MLNGGQMYSDAGVFVLKQCPVSTNFLVHTRMSTSRRGRHVEILPTEKAAPTVPEDADDLEPDVIPEFDGVDAEPLASIENASPSCPNPTTTTGKTIRINASETRCSMN